MFNHRLRSIACLAMLPLLLAGDTPEADLAKELPRIKPLSPKEAQRSFLLHEGFKLEPIATEPVVTDPVAVAYDEDGRIYVVEMRGYPYPENSPTGNVSRIEDVDGDGVFEKRTIFLDGLSWPTGVLPYKGGVFVTVPPNLLYARDTDGDGVADEKRVMFSGFGTQNVQGLLNGLAWGLDGWVYGTAGSNGGEIKNETKADAPVVSVRGRDFRFRPDGSAFEAISGGGQFGHGFDDWGHRFVCNNSNHIRQIILPSHYIERNKGLTVSSVIDDIAVEGGAGPVYRISSAEPWRVVRTRQRKADPVMSKRLAPTELFATGFFTSATGVTIYRGSAYPPEFRGNAFIGDVGGNLVHRKIVEKAGPIFSAKRADAGVEFLASRDNWFRPVNFANTPNGTLLMLDMYRETIEHPASIPEPIKKHLDLTSGRDKGRLYELVPEGGLRRRRPALSKAPTAELVSLLADPDAWWRETAQRLILERADRSAIPALRKMVADRPSPLGRLHALWTLDDLGASEPADILLGLADPEPGVRENAARLAERLASGDSSISAALIKLADDADAMVRFQAAFSLGAVKDERATEALVRIAERDGASPWVRAAVLSSLSGRATPFLKVFGNRKDFGGDWKLTWLEELATLVGVEGSTSDVAQLVTNFIGNGEPSAKSRSALLGLGKGLKRSGRSLASIHDPGLDATFKAAASVAGGAGSVERKIEAARLLALGPKPLAFDALPAMLDARQPVAVQLAAIQGLGDFSGPEVAPVVLGRWKTLSPVVRREAMEVLFARPERVAALLKGIADGQVPASDLEPARRAQLLASADPAVRAEAVKRLGMPSKAERAEVLNAYRPALGLAGNPEKGKAVFKAVCATCHKAEGQGQDVGPNLATVAGRTAEDLLEHILDPNREVAPNYLSYNVALSDGRVVTGIIADESANALTLKRAEGAGDVVPRDRIEQVASSGLSLMPEGLEKGQTPESLADLIAYLRGLAPGGR